MIQISKDFAPPLKMIEPFFKFGSIAYLISIISLLFLNQSLELTDLRVVGWAHLFLLGFVMIIIFGAMAQLIPVVLEVGHHNIDLYRYIFYFLALGLSIMVIGFWFFPWVLSIGGFLVLISMILFLYETFATLKKTSSNSLSVKTIKVGNIFLTIAIIIGFLMALAISIGFNLDINKFLNIHIAFVLIGYIVITIIGISMILLPMFGLAHGYDDSDVNLSFRILVISTLLFTLSKFFKLDLLSEIFLIGIIGGVGLYIRQIVTLYNIRARKIVDIWYKHLYVAYASLFLVIVYLIFWLILGGDRIIKSAIWLFLLGFVTFMINAHLIKIIPFLVWFERFSPLVGKQKVPMLHEMLPNKDVEFSFWLSLLGLIFGLFALMFGSDAMFKGGVSLLIFGAIFMVKTVLYILNYKLVEE